MKEEKKLNYERFQRHGEDFIDVFDDGIPEIDSKWASAAEIYDASDIEREAFSEASGNRIFASIYNLLCEADILDAFHDSPKYEINTNTYDRQEVIEAWEHVSGETYGEEDEEEDDMDLLESEDLYQSLKED